MTILWRKTGAIVVVGGGRGDVARGSGEGVRYYYYVVESIDA